jgi:hypothetical protein
MSSVSFAWRLRNTIMVAMPYPLPEPEIEPPRMIDVHELIACATCHARVDESCKTINGQRRRSHPLRFAPHLCPCGESRGGTGRQLCEKCARESELRSKREYMRRVRAS